MEFSTKAQHCWKLFERTTRPTWLFSGENSSQEMRLIPRQNFHTVSQTLHEYREISEQRMRQSTATYYSWVGSFTRTLLVAVPLGNEFRSLGNGNVCRFFPRLRCVFLMLSIAEQSNAARRASKQPATQPAEQALGPTDRSPKRQPGRQAGRNTTKRFLQMLAVWKHSPKRATV